MKTINLFGVKRKSLEKATIQEHLSKTKIRNILNIIDGDIVYKKDKVKRLKSLPP